MGKEYDYERLGPSISSMGPSKATESQINKATAAKSAFLFVSILFVSIAAFIGHSVYSNVMENRKADLAVGTCFVNRMGTVGIADRRVSGNDDPTYMIAFASGIHSEYRASELTSVACPPELGR